jgi:predicted ribosome quality control (RQC) complex YloA/Tae2 family protein
MGQTLLQKFTGNSETAENEATVAGIDKNSELADLLSEMKAHLSEASKDLLQPRQEAVSQILKKALG